MRNEHPSRSDVALRVRRCLPKTAVRWRGTYAQTEQRSRLDEVSHSSGSFAQQESTATLRLAIHRLLSVLARIAFADIRDVFDEHGVVIPFTQLPADVQLVIAEYRVRRQRNGKVSVHVKLRPKLPALAVLGHAVEVLGHNLDYGSPQLSVPVQSSALVHSTKRDHGMGL